MTPILDALLLLRASDSDPSVGLIFGFISLAVVAIILLTKMLLGGNRDTNSDSLSLNGSGSTAARNAPDKKGKFSALVQESVHGRSANSHDEADAEFEATIAETIPIEAQEKAFYVKVRGTSYRNSDHTSRTRIIGQCSPFDSLALLPQPDAPEYPNAMRVCRINTDEQLGYLESRLGEEISRDMLKNGPRWVAFFRRKTQHPDTGRTVGAVIRLIRLSDKFIATSDAVRKTQVT